MGVSYRINSQALVLLLVLVLTIGVFVFDILTPPDDVSVCFTYAVVISICAFSYRCAAYPCAALATALSALGAFAQTPPDALSLVFFGNRVIAAAAQWLVAFLVTSRKDTEAIIRAQYEAERLKVETSRRFIDVLSHEIGTSLTMIDGQAFRLRRLAAEDEGDVRTRSEKIRQAVRHIEEVVRKVQTASEVDHGKIQFELAEINLSELVADVILQIGSERTISTDLDRLPSMMRGNADMLVQIVSNLLSNAIKYSSADTEISIWGRLQDYSVALSISDRGRGIPDKEKAKLFEPYFRASNSRGVHGTGLGLYIVQRYVASLGGSIDVMSELGIGTTVTVLIPLEPKQLDMSRVTSTHSLH